jgi:hypothetical protein
MKYKPSLPIELENLTPQIISRKGLRQLGSELIKEAKSEFQTFRESLCRGRFEERFGIQRIGQQWRNIPSVLPEKALIGHLRGDYWIGLRAQWYPNCVTFDFDNPGSIDKARAVLESELDLDEEQYRVFTSPSFFREEGAHSGSLHCMIKPTYDGRPATIKLIHGILGPIASRIRCEIYPQKNKIFRLPLGRNQHLVQRNGLIEDEMSWIAAFREIQKITPVALENYPRCEFPTGEILDYPDWSEQRSKAEQLLITGLTSEGLRHDATGVLARYYYFRNELPEEAEKKIADFFRQKHNGFSEEINAGNWPLVDNEIWAWVTDTYKHFGQRGILPDAIHNLQGWITRSDIIHISREFFGSLINQKRYFKLISYARPRQKAGFIPIHRENWRRLIGNRGEKEFKDLAQNRELIEVNNSYRVGAYSKSYRLMKLSRASSDEMLMDENMRAIQDYKEALRMVFESFSEIARATGISIRRLYD